MSRRSPTARFAPGTMIRHRRFGYRGLIFDVDPTFSQSEEWYETMADTRPDKLRPWYHVLVDGEMHTTYVAEDNLEMCSESEQFNHPLLEQLFNVSNSIDGWFETRYVLN